MRIKISIGNVLPIFYNKLCNTYKFYQFYSLILLMMQLKIQKDQVKILQDKQYKNKKCIVML